MGRRRGSMTKQSVFLPFMLSLGLLGCAGADSTDSKSYSAKQEEKERQQSGTIHGNNKGFVLFSNKDDENGGSESGNGGWFGGDDAKPVIRTGVVNPYLWRASLESLDFMPLAQTDSNGGVIITEWYAPSETPDERFKVTVYILDPELRVDALKVAVFRQVNGKKGWVDAPVEEGTASGLEDNILTRAREIRLATSGNVPAS